MRISIKEGNDPKASPEHVIPIKIKNPNLFRLRFNKDPRASARTGKAKATTRGVSRQRRSDKNKKPFVFTTGLLRQFAGARVS